MSDGHTMRARRPPTGVFFTHIMKTGGVSFTEALRTTFGEDASYPSRTRGPLVAQKTAIHLLVDLSPTERAEIACYSVHMPAWTADLAPASHLRVTALRDPVERTISHLRQIAGHPATPNSLEEIYEDPAWRDRLSDYQTRVFSLTRAEYDAQRRSATARDETAGRVAETLSSQTQSPEGRSVLHTELRPWRLTGIMRSGPLADDALARALARLERYDEVGVTDRLDVLAQRVGQRIGRELPAIGRRNVGARDAPVSDSLRAQIRADTTLDAQLYDAAAALARA